MSCLVHSPKGRGHPSPGFTLLELLVTMVVVLLIASLLLPALQAARGDARRAACMANLLGVGKAMALYSEDIGSALPPAPRGTAAAMASLAAQRSLSADSVARYALPALLVPEYAQSGLFRCPSRPQNGTPGYLYELPSLQAPLPLRYVRTPSSLPIAFDAPPASPDAAPDGPHRGLYAVLHVDGHVGCLAVDELKRRIAEWVFNVPPLPEFAHMKAWYTGFYERVHGTPPDVACSAQAH